jgi:hypothetical protein
MKRCGSNSRSQPSPVDSYSLGSLSSAIAPEDFEQLEQWLSCNGKHTSWDGKIYVASTIYWNSAGHEFLQTGCSPNYHAGWWSLACCKHDMREARPFRAEATDDSIPTYVFTLAGLDRTIGQPLVSVAQVDEHHFNTMHEYAQFLLGMGDRALVSSRLTCVRNEDGLLGWRFGDCHANMSGEVGEPNSDHVHHVPEWWQADIDGKHLILLSNRFLLWREPVFVAAKTQKQSKYGTNITSDNLRHLIKRTVNTQVAGDE